MTSLEIQGTLDTNTTNDLKRALSRRQCLNTCNIIFEYLSNFLQYLSVFIVSISTSYQLVYVTWIGVGVGSLAALLITYEKINNKISDKLLKDIIAIQNGNYIDESLLIKRQIQLPEKNTEPINEIDTDN